MQNFELIKFIDGAIELEVNVSPDEKTVWLTLDQIGHLFGRDRTVIGRHLRNIFAEGELDEKSVRAKFAHTASDGKTYTFDFYNLDAIISIGYRVKSKNGILFRKWATNILEAYAVKGYAVNQRRLSALNKTIELQSKIIASAYEIEADDVKNVVDSYIEALTILDDYDHQRIASPKSQEDYVPLTYKDVRTIVENMEFYGKSDVFGVEKEKGKIEGILGAVYQNVFGKEVYPSIREKAAHLLYFMIKDHPFADGCKRIAAASFLSFLAKNAALKPSLSSPALVAITLLTAESNPNDFKSIIQAISSII